MKAPSPSPIACSLLLALFPLPFASGQDPSEIRSFHRGDADADGDVNITDAVVTFSWLFLGAQEPPCLDAVDSNDDGTTNISDGIFTLSFLFTGGEALPEPGKESCGLDPTEDALGCGAYEPCSCGGFIGRPCPEGHVCELPAGSCSGADMLGYCLPRPTVCPKIFMPVCGCDGVTYGNDCERLAAGVTKDHDGPCELAVCGTRGAEPCPKGQYCEFPPGDCGATDGGGACADIPEVCPDVFDPVCGCDGLTYGNDCERAFAGVSKAHDGVCEGPPPPPQG